MLMYKGQVVIHSGKIGLVVDIDSENKEAKIQFFDTSYWLPWEADVLEPDSVLRDSFISLMTKKKKIEDKVHRFLVRYERKHVLHHKSGAG